MVYNLNSAVFPLEESALLILIPSLGLQFCSGFTRRKKFDELVTAEIRTGCWLKTL
jgi:hypothetical protein